MGRLSYAVNIMTAGDISSNDIDHFALEYSEDLKEVSYVIDVLI